MLSAASCRSCGEAKGPCGFGSSQWKRARANKPATCKACALDAENAAPQAVDKAAVLAAFLLRAKQAGGAHRQTLAESREPYLFIYVFVRSDARVLQNSDLLCLI